MIPAVIITTTTTFTKEAIISKARCPAAGEVGSWRERLPAEASEQLAQWAAKHLDAIPFKYSL